MPYNKRKKVTRQRGNKSHGYGSKKKHRGHGSRGGSGLAGTGKRADSKKPSFWENAKYFGQYGFNRNVTVKPVVSVNISDIERKLDMYVAEKLVTKQGDSYTMDLDQLGFSKLLGTGKATKKMNITVKFASAKAIERIEKAGGSVTTTVEKKPKKDKSAPKPAVKKAAAKGADSDEE